MEKYSSLLTSFDSANRVGYIYDWDITNLRIQNLLYISHVVALGMYNKKLISNEKFNASVYGPILPSVYQRLSVRGSSNIKSSHLLSGFFRKNRMNPSSKNYPVNKDELLGINIIDNVCKALSEKKQYELISLTHRKGGSWYETVLRSSIGCDIKEEDILNECNLFYNFVKEKPGRPKLYLVK